MSETSDCIVFSDAAIKRGDHIIWQHGTFAIPTGSVTAIVGTNGTGKTTMMRAELGLLPLCHGSLTVLGKPAGEMNKRIGYVPQSYVANVDSNLTAEQSVLLGLSGTRFGIHPITKAQKAKALEAMEFTGIADKARYRLSELSGGLRQRVAIARALATRPKYLLCDEATSALDPNTTQSILHLLKEINQTLGVTIVVITHEMRVIEQICQRVAVIDQSCIAEIGNVSDVFTHPKSDIAKALILPKSPAENLPPCTGRRLRLVFDGSCSNEPVISRITLECHVPVNILFADTRIVEGSIYGHMVIDLPDDPQQFHDVLRWLDHNHISYLQED